MIKGLVPKIVRVTVLVGSAAVGAEAQTPASFQPGLGDLMTTAFIQPRHIKLGLGGEARCL